MDPATKVMYKAAGKMFASWFGNRSADGLKFHPSETCPECGSKLFREAGSEANWRCPNLDCPEKIRARIERWCSPAGMNIPGGDARLVRKLVGNGLVLDVAELYRLKPAELAGLEGMDRDSAGRFIVAVRASKNREGWRVLAGLVIPHLSEAEAKSLCRHFGSVDNVFSASAERLMEAEGVGETMARGIAQWHGDPVNRRLVRRLRKAGLNFRCEPHPPAKP